MGTEKQITYMRIGTVEKAQIVEQDAMKEFGSRFITAVYNSEKEQVVVHYFEEEE